MPLSKHGKNSQHSKKSKHVRKRNVRKRNLTEQIVYEYVCRRPGLCTYELAKKLKMSGGNVRSTLLRLQEKGLIRFKFDRSNPRIKKLSYSVSSWELLPKSFKKIVKK